MCYNVATNMKTDNKTDVVRARIDAKIKRDAEKVIKRIGVSHSTLINMTYRAVIAEQGIPLSLHVPNEVTKRALREAKDPEFSKNQKRHTYDEFVAMIRKL